MEKHKKIPSLRFPGFNAEWEKKKAGAILRRYSNAVDVVDDQLYAQIGIRSHGKGIFHKDPVSGKSLGNKRVFWIKDGVFIVNIVFAWEQAVSKTTSKEVGMIASHRFPMFLPIENQSDIDYILHFFLTKKGKLLLESASPGGAGRNKTLGQKEFENLKFEIPSLPEQTKIATFLTAVDDRISQLKKKKSLLEQYKKGVIQKIFDQEIRFKDDDGNEFPEWETTKFGSLYTFKSTNSYSRDYLNYESGEVKNIHYGDIHTKFSPQLDTAKENIPYVNNDVDISRIPMENYCKEGDLIIADASEDYSDIGKAIEATKLNNEKVVAGLHTILARPDLSKIAHGFGAYLMKAEYIHFQIRVIAQGTKVLGLSPNRLAEITVKLPCTPEQTRIAKFLTAIDDKISLCDKQITKTEQYKKGLLQQMFV